MLELSVKTRLDISDKNGALRKKGLVPAILYGHKIKNIPLVVDALKLEKAYKQAGGNTLVKLKISKDNKSDVEERIVLIHDISKDPVKSNFIHVDFYQVKMNEAISAEVPFVFVGESLAVERDGGLLIKTMQHIEIEALPQDLIHEIKVDISSLNTFDDKIHIKDLKIPSGVKIKAEDEDVVVLVSSPRTQEELEELEEKPEEKIDEIKVEGEEKKDEENKEENKEE
ncbi:50S ribosomal protein L25 [Patescibacteria group bacterium]